MAAAPAQTEIEHLMKRGYSVHEAREVALPISSSYAGAGGGRGRRRSGGLAERERDYRENVVPYLFQPGDPNE